MRKLLAILLLLAASPCWAAEFNGSTSESVYTGEATAIDYPVVMLCAFKPADVTTRQTLIALTNDGDGGLDGLVLEFRGDQPGDRLAATSWAGGSDASAQQTTGGGVSTRYHIALAVFVSASERHVLDWTRPEGGGRVWRSDTTEITAGDWTKLSIGSTQNGGGQNYFNGRILNARVWFGADDVGGLLADPWLSIQHGSRSGFQTIRDKLVLSEPLGYSDTLFSPTESDVVPVFEFSVPPGW